MPKTLNLGTKYFQNLKYAIIEAQKKGSYLIHK
jgi:hypothetical protein